MHLTAEGELGSIWISEACAAQMGGATSFGDWFELLDLAPGFDTIENPCAVAEQPPVEEPPVVNPPVFESEFVFSRTDSDELRWIALNSDGELGSIWISEACAAQMGGATVFGDWFELNEIAPGFDTIENPCAVMEEPTVPVVPGLPEVPSGS